jgi:CHAT domain-containing protein
MLNRSRARTIQLTCRCESVVTHEHWDVIDEAQRPDLVSALTEGHLHRVRCDACGRTVFVDEPVAVVRTEAATPLVLMFTDREPKALTVPSIDNLPVMWAPVTAAPYLLKRDLDADAAAPDVARAEVERRFGPAAGFIFVEALRHFVVITDPLDVLSLFEPLTQTNMAGFKSLLNDRPELMSDTFQRSTERIASAFPEQAVALQAQGRLMSDATDDPRAAWESFQDALARIGDDMARLMPDHQRLEAAHRAGRHGEVMGLGWSLVECCRDVGAFLVEGEVSELLALALLQQPSEDRADQIEEAVRLLSRAIDRSGEDSVAHARRLSHLAMAYGQRTMGDRRENTDSAISLLREAIRELGTADPDVRAGLQTNLAFALTEGEVEDPIDDLIEAYDLCQSALRWRTPLRNANDWAYTQVNLGAVLARLADHGRARRSDARAAYASVLPYASEIDQQVVATAQTNVARLDRMERGRVFPRWGRKRRLRASRARLADQLEALEGAGPVARGRALHELAQVNLDLGDRAAAIAHLEEAAGLLRPEVSPSDSTSVTTALGSLLAEDGEWTRAAAAFVDAVTASDLRFYQRTTAAGRESEARTRGNLSRWASYALARAGDTRRAVLVLEDGRTRELRLRMGADDEQRGALRAAAPELHAEYQRALADLASAQLADDADAAATRYRRTLEQIRAVPGLEQFGGPTTSDVVAAAATDEQPLVYVNPTPCGTAVLTAKPDGTVMTRFVDITSTAVTRRLMLGLDEHGRQTAPSFLAAASQDGTGVDRALASTLGWVGEALAGPVGDELRAAGADAAALVLCGLLGQFPFHVAPRSSSRDGAETLADVFDITFAPSASLHGAARRRARERESSNERPTLVAIADPTPDQAPLPFSRAEVAQISAGFRPDQRHVAVGAEATSDFLRRHAANATYLHLAGHALGAVFDFRDSHLKLADGDLPLTELSRIGPLISRLAVASACQTAVPDAALSDEAYSVATIFLAAGATSAIASLWPVDDLATALLMIRLYHEHLGEGLTPSRALRRAQIWLRDLKRDEAEAIITRNESLAVLAARRAAIGENILPDGSRPFADPSHWAAFVAMGV